LLNNRAGAASDTTGTFTMTGSDDNGSYECLELSCPAGTYYDSTIHTDMMTTLPCTNCAAGTYNTTTGQTSCSNCEVGYYCTGGSNRTPCGTCKTTSSTRSTSSAACTVDVPSSCSNSNYNASANTWSVSSCSCFSSGLTSFSGISKCSTTAVPSGCGSTNQANCVSSSTPSSTVGGNCWCQVAKINDNSKTASKWVYDYNLGSTSASYCASICANRCGSSAELNSAFRSLLFTGLGY
jgi:hypothetical protein